MDQSNWFVEKKKSGLVKHPQLINMKYNKHPQCYKRGSHNMAIKRVLVTIEGKAKKKAKKRKKGRGKITL